MGREIKQDRRQDLDELRLFALGRIPRCTRCPRYRALAAACDRRTVLISALPAAPSFCSHQVCAPLVDRHGTGRDRDDEPRIAAFGI